MKVLIVEDNELLAWVVQKILEDEGYEVRLAGDGKAGYAAYLLFKPNLIITDIQMPRENGLELMKHVRMHEPLIRTIYMSTDLSQYWLPLEEEKKNYPVSLLRKPFSKDKLIEALSEPVAQMS